MHSNRIEKIEPNAFSDAENLGSLMLNYNTIRDVFESPDCLKNDAQKFVFSENTLYCSCEIRWIHSYQVLNNYIYVLIFKHFFKNSAFLNENYCGREESYKVIMFYKGDNCPPLVFPSSSSTAPITIAIDNKRIKQQPMQKSILQHHPNIYLTESKSNTNRIKQSNLNFNSVNNNYNRNKDYKMERVGLILKNHLSLNSTSMTTFYSLIDGKCLFLMTIIINLHLIIN